MWGKQGRKLQEQEAESQFLRRQAGSRDSDLKVGWDCVIPKPGSSDLLPPATK